MDEKRRKAEERRRQAEIIYGVLAEEMNVSQYMEDDYLKAIEKGLKMAEEEQTEC